MNDSVQSVQSVQGPDFQGPDFQGPDSGKQEVENRGTGGREGVVKSEILSTKFETNSKDRNSNVRNKTHAINCGAKYKDNPLQCKGLTV